jgi:hypothetical protein
MLWRPQDVTGIIAINHDVLGTSGVITWNRAESTEEKKKPR